MAWARDSITGEPVYILELDGTRTGARCGCECPSCALALTAVNAAKKEYLRRPHFRHPDGAGKSECMYLAARLAALELLREQGIFLLPSRKISGSVIGLSGLAHEAWVEQKPEQVRIRDFSFSDKAAALLTLDDGRQLRIELTGTGGQGDSAAIPTILLNMQALDPAIASMSPQELKSRLTLAADNFCWASHWNDLALQVEAQEKARELADQCLDLAPPDESVLAGVEPSFRRETLLHLEVKKILCATKQIWVPPLEAAVHQVACTGVKVERQWSRPSWRMPLSDVLLEKKLGGTIPDVIATIPQQEGGRLMIEVTVSNKIDDDRLARIRQQGVPALEIDLSVLGGKISRDDLARLVVQGLEAKRWLYHPALEAQAQILEGEVAREVSVLNETEQSRRSAMAPSLQDLARDFLDAVRTLSECYRDAIPDQVAIGQETARVRGAAEKLAMRGYGEATDTQLSCGRSSVVSRILSIQLGRGVGYRLDSTLAVMNAIRQSRERNRSNHTIYLIAEKTYRTSASPPHPPWYTAWVSQIKDSIGRNEPTYIRDGKFDRLLSLLFPEMTSGLAHGYGTAAGPKASVSAGKATGQAQAAPQLAQTAGKGGWAGGGVSRHDIRGHLQQINFDDVLREARAIRAGEPVEKWLVIWNDRYALRGELDAIGERLVREGFPGIEARVQAWKAIDRAGYYPLARY